MPFFFCDIPFECCSFTKIFPHLYSDWVDLHSIRYIVESVFARSLSENVEVFKDNRTTDNTHSLYSYVAIHLWCIYPHTIQVWGIVSFIVVTGLSTTFT